ncbi:MAG: hypothetical protein HY900_00755 [Deltaproteobacteria bacterium]|nr:hypothetical protein [Deltaproteobacteria bacterium]
MKLPEITAIAKRGPILGRPRFGCLAGSYSLNLTRGCAFSCVYCYARGYPNAPPAGHVYVYRDLPERLASELDNPRRRSTIGSVALNTASDCFQPLPEILGVTYRAMEVLLDRRIPFSFLTKGTVPGRFLELFARGPQLVTGTVCLVCASREYRDAYEPGAAAPEERLETLRGLRAAGIRAEVRVDPIIPFVTDREGSIRELCGAVVGTGVTTLSLSYLHLRPKVLEILRDELPEKHLPLVLGAFGADASLRGELRRTKLLPLPLRKRGYERFQRIAREYGLTAMVCACKNFDMPGEVCSAGPIRPAPSRLKRREQLSLF